MSDPIDLWLQALESGDYRQGTNALAYDRDGEQYHCCLGVACEVAIAHGIQVSRHPLSTDQRLIAYNGRTFNLPNVVRQWLGLRDQNGEFPIDGGLTESLARLNDSGQNFHQIAATIRRYRKDLCS